MEPWILNEQESLAFTRRQRAARIVPQALLQGRALALAGQWIEPRNDRGEALSSIEVLDAFRVDMAHMSQELARAAGTGTVSRLCTLLKARWEEPMREKGLALDAASVFAVALFRIL